MNSVGIVTYNPDIGRLKESLNILILIADYIYVVDNSSDNLLELEYLFLEYSKVRLIKNQENLGISKALNQIVEFYHSIEIKWVLLLDQDSIVSKEVFEVYNKYVSQDSIAILCPQVVDVNVKDIRLSHDIEFVKECITSGSYLNIPICRKLGMFDEKMFIDLVDFEYCYRAISNSYKILQVNSIVLSHQLGNLRVINLFFFKINVTNHSPIRVFYKVRNYRYLSKKYPEKYPLIKIYKIIISIFIKVFLFERNKLSKIKMIFKGFRAGRNI